MKHKSSCCYSDLQTVLHCKVVACDTDNDNKMSVYTTYILYGIKISFNGNVPAKEVFRLDAVEAACVPRTPPPDHWQLPLSPDPSAWCWAARRAHPQILRRNQFLQHQRLTFTDGPESCKLSQLLSYMYLYLVSLILEYWIICLRSERHKSNKLKQTVHRNV